MITVKEKIRLIESCFGKAKLSNDNKNVVAFCPVCKSQGKDKFKLAIGIEKGMYHCWVCESKGRNIGRLALKYSNQKKAATELYSYFKTDKEDEQQLRLEEEKTVKLPEDFRLIATDRGHAAKLARAYLENRGFTKEDIWNFRVGISNQYGYKNRIIFPSFDSEQNLNYYTARTIDPKIKRRYQNCNVSRKDIVFREFDIDFSKELILVEGVFDLLHTPDNSTCILGSWIDKKYKIFHEIIKNQTPVVLCFDHDAIDKTQKIAKMLYEYCVPVRISQHSKKDFGDMSKKEVNYYISNSKPYDNVSRMTYLINEIRSGSIF
jgi:DNA primase